MDQETCFSCGGRFPAHDGATHATMLSSPGCWKAYGDVLAREYEDPLLFGRVHTLTVAAYALQHPGDVADRRAVQSVWVHFCALLLRIDEGAAEREITAAMKRLAGTRLPPLPPRPARFDVTLADVRTESRESHAAGVERWADCAYRSWRALREPAWRLLRAR